DPGQRQTRWVHALSDPVDISTATTAQAQPPRAATGAGVRVADHDEAMARALDEARAAGAAGEVPVGAVVIVDGTVVATGHNERQATNDPSAHAELLALRRACADAGSWRLPG